MHPYTHSYTVHSYRQRVCTQRVCSARLEEELRRVSADEGRFGAGSDGARGHSQPPQQEQHRLLRGGLTQLQLVVPLDRAALRTHRKDVDAPPAEGGGRGAAC